MSYSDVKTLALPVAADRDGDVVLDAASRRPPFSGDTRDTSDTVVETDARPSDGDVGDASRDAVVE